MNSKKLNRMEKINNHKHPAKYFPEGKLPKILTQNFLKMKLIAIAFLFLLPGIVGCKKLIEVQAPVTTINSANVYTTDVTAAAVLTGLYTNMMNSNSLTAGGIISMSFFPALSADELTLYPGANSSTYTAYYANALTNQNTGSTDFWDNLYPMIYITNSAIDGLNSSTGLTPAVKKQALGEAEFMRAYCFFYLVNLYGDVPLTLTTNYKVNAVIARTPKVQVWQQIIADLKSAQGLLSPNYLDATLENTTTQRLRPTKWAAAALLARSYLYYGNLTSDASNYSNAVAEADSVINNSSLFSLSSLNNAFLANSTEAIWQLQPVAGGWNTPDAQLFIIPSTGPNAQWPVYLSPQLLDSFEPGDQRRTNWVDSVTIGNTVYYYAYKYKSATLNAPVTEYEMVLRLGEQYLIRAEAEANGAGSGINAAIADLNIIRKRAGLPSYFGATDKASVLNAILHERQVELFTEWGNRWLDLKRTNTVTAVMGNGGVCASKGGTWNPDWQLYPIQLTQLQFDPNLIQNQGY